MCGRGGHDFSWKQVYEYLQLGGEPPEGGLRRLNVAPSRRKGDDVAWTRLPVVVPDPAGGREMTAMIWPLIPPWLKGELPKFATANCRSEPDQPFSGTVRAKPAFRNAWKNNRRCLVPFSWFYEWDQRTRPKQPWRVMPSNAPMLVMAGLWDESTPADGRPRRSCTLVTTGPNGLLTEIGHHRAPVMLQPGDWQTWLTGSAEQAEKLIRSPAEGSLKAARVTRKVNNPEYEGDDLLDEAVHSEEALH